MMQQYLYYFGISIVGLTLLVLLYIFYRFYVALYLEVWKFRKMDPSIKTQIRPFKGLVEVQRECLAKHGDSHYYVKKMIKDDPDQLAYLTNLGDKVFLQLTDTNLVKQFLLNPKLYDKFKGVKHLDKSFSKGIFFIQYDNWKSIRALVGHAFNYEHLKRMIPIMKNTTKDFMLKTKANLEQNNVLEVLDATQSIIGQFYVRTFLSNQMIQKTVAGRNLSLALSDFCSLSFDRSRTAINLISLLFLGEKSLQMNFQSTDKKLQELIDGIRQVLLQILNERIQKGKFQELDFLNLYINQMLKRQKEYNQLKQAGKDTSKLILISKQDVVHQIITFYFAAIDTTGHLLSFALYCICEYPEYGKKLEEQINRNIVSEDDINFENLQKLDYTQKFLNECLRMWPPAVGTLARFNRQDLQLGPYFLKKGTLIGTNIIGILHNPKYYKNPEKFNPERWYDNENLSNDPYSFIPFSAGPKSCIGKQLSMMESKLILIYFLKYFKLSRTAVPLRVYCKFLYQPQNGKIVKLDHNKENNW